MSRRIIRNGLVVEEWDDAARRHRAWSDDGKLSEDRPYNADEIKALGTAIVNVKVFGAAGDGVTDDTSAIQAALTAVPASGGVVTFPPGTYLTTGNLVVSSPTALIGAGSGDDTRGTAITKVVCSSPTASLFKVQAHGTRLTHMALFCSAPTPTDGAAVLVTVGDFTRFEDVSIVGFCTGVDMLDGNGWVMRGCRIGNPVRYALRISHPDNPDAGDQAISDCIFWTTRVAQAAIRIESGGGAKITGCKINSGNTGQFVHGIDLTVAAGVSTSILLVSTTSIENVTGNGINVATATTSGFYSMLVFTGVQFGLYGGTGNAIKVAPATTGQIRNVSVSGCVFLGIGTANRAAIVLSMVDNAVIVRGPVEGFARFLDNLSSTNVLLI